ncbi:MAG: hypothetical protein Q7S86_05765 [bacterium]|nr:hypothetical protein [bacterium]
MATTLSLWQWVGIIVIAFDLLVFFLSSRIAIRCNIFTGLLNASPKKRLKVQAWFEKLGGYDPRVHSGAAIVTMFSFLILIAMLILLAPRG